MKKYDKKCKSCKHYRMDYYTCDGCINHDRYNGLFEDTSNIRYSNYISYSNIVGIKNVVFNNPATIVFWVDGSKTVVKTQNGEEFDPEKGLAMAIAKKYFGNKGLYFNQIKKWTESYYEKEFEEPDSLFNSLDNASYETLVSIQNALGGFNPSEKSES